MTWINATRTDGGVITVTYTNTIADSGSVVLASMLAGFCVSVLFCAALGVIMFRERDGKLHQRKPRAVVPLAFASSPPHPPRS